MLITIIADDDVRNYYGIEKAFQAAQPCITFHADSSKYLFRLIKNVVPDLIFLKEKMPGLDVMYCIKKLRSIKTNNTIPVVVYSGGSDAENYDSQYKGYVQVTIPDPDSDVSMAIHSILTCDWKNNTCEQTHKAL